MKRYRSDSNSSLSGSTDPDSSSADTDDSSYNDYVGCNPDGIDEDDDLGEENDGDDGDGDSLQIDDNIEEQPFDEAILDEEKYDFEEGSGEFKQSLNILFHANN